MYHTANESGMPCGYSHHEKRQKEKESCYYFHGVLTGVCEGFLKIESKEGHTFKIPFHDIWKVAVTCHKEEECHHKYEEEDDYFFHSDQYDDCHDGHKKEVKCWSKYDFCKQEQEESVSRFVFIEGKWRRKKQTKQTHEPSVIDKLCSKLGCHVKVYIK